MARGIQEQRFSAEGWDTVSKIIVPEGMLKAFAETKGEGLPAWDRHRRKLEAALRWLSENPIVPSESEACRLAMENNSDLGSAEEVIGYITGWQRRMFLGPRESE